MDKIQVILQNENYIKGLVEASGGDFEVRIKNAIIDGVRDRAEKLLGDKNSELNRVVESAKENVVKTAVQKYFTTTKDKWGYDRGYILKPEYRERIEDEIRNAVQREIDSRLDTAFTKLRSELTERLKTGFDNAYHTFVKNFDFEKAFREEMQKMIAKKFAGMTP
jgi:hypothetical protein